MVGPGEEPSPAFARGSRRPAFAFSERLLGPQPLHQPLILTVLQNDVGHDSIKAPSAEKHVNHDPQKDETHRRVPYPVKSRQHHHQGPDCRQGKKRQRRKPTGKGRPRNKDDGRYHGKQNQLINFSLPPQQKSDGPRTPQYPRHEGEPHPAPYPKPQVSLPFRIRKKTPTIPIPGNEACRHRQEPKARDDAGSEMTEIKRKNQRPHELRHEKYRLQSQRLRHQFREDVRRPRRLRDP